MARIEERSGSYTTRVSLTDPLTGLRVQKRVSARTKGELRALVRELENRNQQGRRINPERTSLSDWLDAWLAIYRQSPHSLANREQIVRLHLKPDAIAAIPLGLLTRAHVQAFIDRKVDSVAPSYLGGMLATLRTALEAAVRRGLIDTNPCTSLERPARHKPPWTVLSDTQARAFMASLAGELHPAFWVLAVVLGIRRGELLALRWDDVDLKRGTLTIRRTMSRRLDPDNPERRVWYIAEIPKSTAANRTLRLPRVCLDAMQDHRRRWVERRLAFGDSWSADDAVFDSGAGAHHRDPNWPDNTMRRFRALGIVPVKMRVHDLRHTAASHLLRHGIPVVTVAEMLGHANPSITLATYSHVIEGMQEDAVAVIDAQYGAS